MSAKSSCHETSVWSWRGFMSRRLVITVMPTWPWISSLETEFKGLFSSFCTTTQQDWVVINSCKILLWMKSFFVLTLLSVHFLRLCLVPCPPPLLLHWPKSTLMWLMQLWIKYYFSIYWVFCWANKCKRRLEKIFTVLVRRNVKCWVTTGADLALKDLLSTCPSSHLVHALSFPLCQLPPAPSFLSFLSSLSLLLIVLSTKRQQQPFIHGKTERIYVTLKHYLNWLLGNGRQTTKSLLSPNGEIIIYQSVEINYISSGPYLKQRKGG